MLTRDVWLMCLFRRRHAGTEVTVNTVGKWATALIMLALALLMATSATWPLVLFAVGVASRSSPGRSTPWHRREAA